MTCCTKSNRYFLFINIIEFGIEEHEAKQCVETFIVNAQFLGIIKTFILFSYSPTIDYF